MQGHTTDFLIIGGGIIGISLALECKRRYPDQRITVIEKEPRCGLHASGRNSGVLHAGFYYSADSLKARLTREGNRALREYCLAKGLPLNLCGKLVVARNEADLAGLDELLKRAQANGVELREVTPAEARAIEPRVRCHQRALYSPTTAVTQPQRVMEALLQDAGEAGIIIHTGCAYRGHKGKGIKTNLGEIMTGHVINAAGLYADKIARDYGYSRHYRIHPFKGLYLHSEPETPPLKTNIYPVPELNKPFLGVHLTVTADGGSKIGPTAIPAFWREQYQGLANFKATEALEILYRDSRLLLNNHHGFRQLALEELKKYGRDTMIRQASELADGIEPNHYRHWARPGIRAQLINIRDYSLVMDFVVEGDKDSTHILNAVSPAFTCAFPFARLCMDKIKGALTI